MFSLFNPQNNSCWVSAMVALFSFRFNDSMTEVIIKRLIFLSMAELPLSYQRDRYEG
jgi:hypothetical protein